MSQNQNGRKLQMSNNKQTSSEGPLNARDLMVIVDALRSVVTVQNLGTYHNTAYKTAWAKVFNLLDEMEVPSSLISKLEDN